MQEKKKGGKSCQIVLVKKNAAVACENGKLDQVDQVQTGFFVVVLSLETMIWKQIH
jgi:hypothetical protein